MGQSRSVVAGRGWLARPGARWLLPLLVSLGASFQPDTVDALQMERVLSYDVTIDIQRDGWMEVREEIRFRVSPREIKGRIRRNLPIGPLREDGLGRLTAPLEFVHPDESTRLEVHSVGGPPATSGVRVWLGPPGRTISPGDHYYGFSYRTARWLVFDGDRTRLTWNVMRNAWSVPIQAVTVQVYLPGQVGDASVVLDGWTGPDGGRNSPLMTSFDVDAEPGSRATFRTTGLLRRDEGVTIHLDFPAGLVSPPTPEQEADWRRLDWKAYTDSGNVALVVFVFFVLVWALVGRDPQVSPVVVRYDPPEGVSPAAIGFLDKRGYGQRLLTAAVLSLAHQGVLEVERTGREWTVRRIRPNPRTLTPDERAVAESLLPDHDALVITGISHKRFLAASNALRRELKRRFRGRYFVANRGWSVLGLLISMAGFAFLVSRTRFGLTPDAWNPAVVLLVFGVPMGQFLTRSIRQWRMDLAEMSPRPSLFAASVFPLLMTMPLGLFGFMAHELYEAVPPHLFVAVLVLCGVNAVFFQLLERPTVAGQELLSQVEGFKRYLTTTEKGRLERLSTKESQELYERMLPYAVALGLSIKWGAAFGDAIAELP